MPRYDYYCEANGKTIEVFHSIKQVLTTWCEVCEIANIELGDTPPDAEVRIKITTPPMTSTPVGDSDLKNLGFTKLVKRQDGTYENVTRTGTEKRYLDPNDPTSMPHLHKKITD
jgi:hypothetical protein